MEFLRTPEDRFSLLPGFPFTPRYLDWHGLRLHYVDEGAGAPVVMFHGEPTWSFLYRKVMPPVLQAGYRVIAPDYPGFGRSDKPLDPAFYTYDRHTRAMADLVEHLGLQEATAVVHDWGGPIGLRVATQPAGRFHRLCLLNTSLFTGPPSEGFRRWRDYAARHPDLPVGELMRRSLLAAPPEAVIAAYDAPFPNAAAKAGVRRFPEMVPTSPEDPGAAEMRAVRSALRSWQHPALVLFSTSDPIFPVETGRRLAHLIPGAGPLETVDGAGHFLPEDRGEAVGQALVAFLRRTD